MRVIQKLFHDERLNGLCTYCGDFPDTTDHVPSKALLFRPLPDNLPIVPACIKCNNSFSLDEEYVSCFIDCVISGGTSSDVSINERTQRTFEHNPRLRHRIELSKSYTNGSLLWNLESSRFENVILKLARGHAFYENSEHQFEHPIAISYTPLAYMTDKQLYDFESKSLSRTLLPELGSRGFIRGVESNEWGWLVVQPSVYRYTVCHITEGLLVQIVLREYLACSIIWD